MGHKTSWQNCEFYNDSRTSVLDIKIAVLQLVIGLNMTQEINFDTKLSHIWKNCSRLLTLTQSLFVWFYLLDLIALRNHEQIGRYKKSLRKRSRRNGGAGGKFHISISVKTASGARVLPTDGSSYVQSGFSVPTPERVRQPDHLWLLAPHAGMIGFMTYILYKNNLATKYHWMTENFFIKYHK
jgi:hypothetical protein